MLPSASLCVFLIAVHLTRVSGADTREQAAAIGQHEDEKLPISEHEFPKENISTRPDYRGEGHWATPDPNSGIDLGFVPIKLYAQVRRSSTVKHLPRSDALASASTAEEIINAPRLREVVSTKKISEVYTEEGYEDSGYDHGGFAKEAEKEEGYDHHEGSKRKGKPGKQKTGAPYDDSESQGTQTQVKQVGTEGEKLNNSDSAHPLNTWMRHKVMRNETRLMFVENKGEDGVPMKVMASYSHTIQHPGGNTSQTSEYPSPRTPLSNLGTVKNWTNVWKQVQKVQPSNIKPQTLKLVKGKSGQQQQQQQQQQQLQQQQQQQQQKQHQQQQQRQQKQHQQQQQQHQQQQQQHQQQQQQHQQQQQQHQQQQQQHQQQQQQQQRQQKQQQHQQQQQQQFNQNHHYNQQQQHQIQKQHHQKQQQQHQHQQQHQQLQHQDQDQQHQHQKHHHRHQQQQNQYYHHNRQQQQPQDQHQQRIPFFFLPTDVYQPQDESINSYNQLMEKLYGTATYKFHPISTGKSYKKNNRSPVVKDGEGKTQNQYKAVGLSSNSLNEQRYEGSSVSEQHVKPSNTNVDVGFVARTNHKFLPALTSTPLDSVYQRKHPSIPLEEIQNVQHVEIPVQATSSDFTRRVEQQYILTTPDGMEYPSQTHNGRYIQPAVLQDRQDSVVIGSNKATPAIKYTSKYKEIRKLKNPDEKLTTTTTTTTLLPTFEDPLSLWAKFIEALTLAQYSQKGKKFQDPRQGAAVTVGAPSHEGPMISTPVSTTYSVSQHAKEEDRKTELDYHGASRQTAGDVTSMISHNLSQSELIPLEDESTNQTLLYTSSSPRPEFLDLVNVESLNNETQNINASSLTDLQTEQSEQEYKKTAPGGYSNTQEERGKITRRMDTDGYGTPQYLSGDEEEIRLQEEERLLEEEKDKELHKNVNKWKDALQDAEKGIIKTPQVNTRKYPFYKSLPSNSLSLYSPLRYATNPKAVPLKTEGGMEFYESREHVQCPEVKGPQDVVPERTAPGEWNKKPRPSLPRLRGLGDKIDCLRTKYFGSDPLDNPFFKENTVGLPQTMSSDKVESVIDDDALRFYADIMEHIRNIGDINNIPTYSMPKPQYAEFKSPEGHNVKHISEPQTGSNESNNSDFPPVAGQYSIDASSSHNAIKNPVWNNINTVYPPSLENEGTQVLQNDKYPTNTYISPLLPKYRNISDDSLKYSTAVLSRTPVTTASLSSSLQGPHSFAQFESVTHTPQPHENTYKPQHQEVILGMVPPPVPTQTYLIIKSAPHMPKIHPTSILSLLSEPSVTVRPRKTLANPYYYRNIQGLVPPSIQFHTRNHVHHEDNELTAANTGQSNQFAENPMYGNVRNIPYEVQIEPNADVMVAEETSKPEILSDVQVFPLHTETNRTQRRERRGVKGYDGENYDDLDNDEHSTKPDDISRRQNRRLNTRKQIKSDKPKRYSSSAKKKPARGRNSLDKVRRRMDQEDDLEYQYDDDDTVPNRKENKILKGNNRREDSERRDDDVLQYPDYLDTEGYDSEEPESKFSSNPATEAMPKVIAGKKTQTRTSGSDSRRGEPRYHNSEEKRTGDSAKPSRIRTETKVGEGLVKEKKRSSLKNGGSQRYGKNVSLKLQETKLNNSTKTKLSCRDRDTDDGCKDYKNERRSFSSEEHKDDNLPHIEESITDKEEDKEQETTRPKYQKKISSTGFKHNEEAETDVILQERSKKNESVNKLKSNYSESVMSADQINRILGGFMSRHNPSYSSRYKAEETTVVPEPADSTTVTTSTTTNTTSTASTRADGETKGSRSKVSSTSSGSKDFQKARVIPILNTKVVPELVTSTTKSPESNTNRRRVSTSRSADKQDSPPKSSKTNRAKTFRSKKITRTEDKPEKQEETESRREEKPERVSTRTVSPTSKDKANVSRRRNTGSRGNVRKQSPQSDVTATTTEANRSRKRIPIRIKSNEKENNDTSSTSKGWRSSRKGRENILTQQSSSNFSQAENNNATEDLNVNESENSTTLAPRRLQAIEHRRVTKEEIFTTTYYPEDELAREMERQSELDAAELEAADESRETEVREDSDEDEDEDEEDDIYEPFESYNYESRHVQYPGNKLHHEDKPYADKNWNSKRGYYIYHAPDHPSHNHYHTQNKRKEQKGTQKSENNYDYGQAGPREDHSAKLISDALQYAGTDSDSDGPSTQTQTPEDTGKVVTKEGIKGFYVQRSLDKAEVPSPNSRKGDKEEKYAGKVLTYVVNQNTGIGAWVSGDANDDYDATDIKKTTGTGDRRKGEAEVNEPVWVSVRESSKSRNNWTMTSRKPPKEEKATLKNAENEELNLEEETKDITDEQVEENGRNKQVDKFKSNRGKSQKRKYSSDHDSEKDTVNVSPESTSGDRSLKRNNIKKVSQSRFHKNSGKPRQNGNTETIDESADGYTNLNHGDGTKEIKNLEKAVRDKADEKDRANKKGSDTYELDRASKSEKPIYKRNKSQRHNDHAKKFRDTDANIKSSASELRYYEEELPEETENNEHQNDQYKEETSDEEQEDGEEYHDESTESAFGTVLRQTLPKRRDHTEDEKGVDHVQQRYVKHPGERYYYYADEKEEILGKERKAVKTDKTPISRRNKEGRRKDEHIED